MPWFKVDDTFPHHAKVMAAGNAAVGLWVRAGAWSMQQLTDGFVPSHVAKTLGTTTEARKLVATGLWIEVDGGFRFHEWTDVQRTKEQVRADRNAAAERQRHARERAKSQRESRRASRRDTSVSHGPPDQTRPDQTSSSAPQGDGSPSRALAIVGDNPTAQTLTAEWIDHCNEQPPRQVIGQVAKHLKTMLDEGIDPDRIRRALAEWNRKGLHPSTLPSVVHEIGNRGPARTNRQEAEDEMWNRAMDRAVEREREMGLRP